MVAVVVDTVHTERTFHLHEDLLKHYSGYFYAALNESWAKQRSLEESFIVTLRLPEHDPEVFDTFFHWVYTRKLYSVIDDGGKIPLAWKTIVKAYIFGYTHFAPSFCNAAIDLLYKKIVQCK